MNLAASAAETVSVLKTLPIDWTKCLVVTLGSGLAEIADYLDQPTSLSYTDLPAFPQPRVGSHQGQLKVGSYAGRPVALLQGRAHYYETGAADAMHGVVATLAQLQVSAWLMTNAAGSLHSHMGPGSLMLITDHINFSGLNPLINLQSALAEERPFDARFVDMGEAYDASLRAQLEAAAAAADVSLFQGVYAWFSGPSFETPAEIRAARILGADAVGMSTVPEVILARYYGLRVAGLSVMTNLAAGMDDEQLSHAGTMAAAKSAETDLKLLLQNLGQAPAC